MSKQKPELYLKDIIISIKNIKKYTQGISFKTFVHDTKTIDAVVRNIEIIGEAANNIPNETKRNNSNIPWREIISMRNKVLHEYFGVDAEILWKTIKEDLPELQNQIQNMIDELNV